MTQHRIIMDCDPGQDDAVSLLLALASPDELDIVSITAVSGNLPVETTERNARMMCDLAGRPDIPVFAGCSTPMRRDAIHAAHIHGDTGVDGMDVFVPETPLRQEHAVDHLIDTLSSAEPGSITLVPSGPLTNVATAFAREPGVIRGVKQIVLMGGAMREGGNYTPSAEFNIVADPDAARIVFECGRPIVAIGLDATHQVISTRERVARIRQLGTMASEAVAGMLSFFNRYDRKRYGLPGAPLHDPCTIAYLLQPRLFESKLCNVSVEVDSPLTLGHTAVDFWHATDRPKNTEWVYSVDADGFYELLVDRLARLDGK